MEVGCDGAQGEQMLRPAGGRLPFLYDDDDGAQQKDEDHQTSGAHPQNQTHLLGVLGDLQSLALVLARRWEKRNTRSGVYNDNNNLYCYKRQKRVGGGKRWPVRSRLGKMSPAVYRNVAKEPHRSRK